MWVSQPVWNQPWFYRNESSQGLFLRPGHLELHSPKGSLYKSLRSCKRWRLDRGTHWGQRYLGEDNAVHVFTGRVKKVRITPRFSFKDTWFWGTLSAQSNIQEAVTFWKRKSIQPLLKKKKNQFLFIPAISLLNRSTTQSPSLPVFFLLKKNLMYFNWRLITLQSSSGFCHTLTWISHECTCVPHPEPPSHLPSHPIPQGQPSAPALSALSHALKLDWRSISHMIIYTFLKSCKGDKFSGFRFSVDNLSLSYKSWAQKWKKQWLRTVITPMYLNIHLFLLVVKEFISFATKLWSYSLGNYAIGCAGNFCFET